MYTNRTFIRYITLSCAFFSYSQVIYICRYKILYIRSCLLLIPTTPIIVYIKNIYSGIPMPLDGYR
jgi:hypothetical protein